MQRDRLSIALDDQRHRHARVHAYDLLDVLEALDIGAVDIRDDIAGMDFARFGRAARLNLANFWRGGRLTLGREQDREAAWMAEKIGADGRRVALCLGDHPATVADFL